MATSMTLTESMTERDLEATLTDKGQVTVPASIRARLGLKPKDKIRFEMAGNTVQLSSAPSRLVQNFGAVTPWQRPEDWRDVRTEVENAVAQEVPSKT